jgi:hypothetical protein
MESVGKSVIDKGHSWRYPILKLERAWERIFMAGGT